MRLLILLAILLAFPLTEFYVLVQLAQAYGWSLAAYLLFATIAGWTLIQEERFAVFGRLFAVAQSGQHPISALLSSAKRLIAGLLLIFPGVISDLFAVLLLLIPVRTVRTRTVEDEVIEGEWRREE